MHTPRTRRAFTLIELLVVIAIIAILASILFPVFAQAREKARQTQCISNLRNVGTAIQMYTQDYDENLPYVAVYGGGTPMHAAGYGWSQWVQWIKPYVKNYGVFNCPSSTRNFTFGPANDRYICNLGYNEMLFHNSSGWANLATLSSVPAGVTGVAVIADSGYGPMFNDWGNADNGNQRCPTDEVNFGLQRIKYAVNPPWEAPRPNCATRHGGSGSSIVFADGHAKFLAFGKIRGGYQTACQNPVVRPNLPQCP